MCEEANAYVVEATADVLTKRDRLPWSDTNTADAAVQGHLRRARPAGSNGGHKVSHAELNTACARIVRHSLDCDRAGV